MTQEVSMQAAEELLSLLPPHLRVIHTVVRNTMQETFSSIIDLIRSASEPSYVPHLLVLFSAELTSAGIALAGVIDEENPGTKARETLREAINLAFNCTENPNAS